MFRAHVYISLLIRTLMTAVVWLLILKCESVFECPVLERRVRAPRDRPRPRDRATPAPHSIPRDHWRKNGRQRQTRRAGSVVNCSEDGLPRSPLRRATLYCGNPRFLMFRAFLLNFKCNGSNFRFGHLPALLRPWTRRCCMYSRYSQAGAL